MKIQEEIITWDLIEEIKPLLQEHYEEICEYKDIMKLNPDYNKYLELQKLGMLHTVTVRDEGKLIGYAITFTIKNLHYQDCLMGLNDILFISKPYRNGSLAIRLLKYVEDALKNKGVQILHYHIKVKHDHARLFEKLGYVCIEKLYGRSLWQ